MTRIAIDYTAAHEQGGGIGRYVRELAAALARLDTTWDYRLFVAGVGGRPLPTPPAANFSWRPTRLSPRWLARIWHRAQLPLPVEIFTGNVDLFHATDFVLPPTLPGARTLLTVHDLSFLRVPESASPALRRYLERVVPRSVRRADHILADSQATKDDLVDLYDTPEAKITVLYCGVDAAFKPVEERSKLDDALDRHGLRAVNYVMSLGTLHPRKNYSRVVRAMKQVREAGLDLHFVVAGGLGWQHNDTYRTIAETRMEEYVHLLGFVDDADLPALYSAARMLITPSLYEGFGLPLLEAMACGTPVIASNLSSLPEVVGDAGLLVDPLDVDSIRAAITRLETDVELRTQMVERGLQRAQAFSWEKSAEQLRSVYHELIHG